MSKNKIYLWNIRFWRIFGFYILEILDTDKHKKNWIPDANQWLIFLCWNLRYWQVFEIPFIVVFEILTNMSKKFIFEIPNMSLNRWNLRCWQIWNFFIFEFVDADECTLGTANCPSNSQCVNRDQGFDCNCVTGYTKVGDTCQGKPLVPF